MSQRILWKQRSSKKRLNAAFISTKWSEFYGLYLLLLWIAIDWGHSMSFIVGVIHVTGRRHTISVTSVCGQWRSWRLVCQLARMLWTWFVQRTTVCAALWEGTNKFHVSWSWLGWPSHEELDGLGMWHLWGRKATRTGFYWGNLRETNHLEDLDVDGELWLGSPCSG